LGSDFKAISEPNIGLGGIGFGNDLDFDSPDRPILTPIGLQRFLAVEEAWVEKNTQARLIPGQFKAGRYWRYRRADIEKQMLSGQVLLEKKKFTLQGLKKRNW